LTTIEEFGGQFVRLVATLLAAKIGAVSIIGTVLPAKTLFPEARSPISVPSTVKRASEVNRFRRSGC